MKSKSTNSVTIPASLKHVLAESYAVFKSCGMPCIFLRFTPLNHFGNRDCVCVSCVCVCTIYIIIIIALLVCVCLCRYIYNIYEC